MFGILHDGEGCVLYLRLALRRSSYTAMAFFDDEEKEKEGGAISDGALDEVLEVDEDADEDETPEVVAEEDEKWE